jgi:hypothetical protein
MSTLYIALYMARISTSTLPSILSQKSNDGILTFHQGGLDKMERATTYISATKRVVTGNVGSSTASPLGCHINTQPHVGP